MGKNGRMGNKETREEGAKLGQMEGRLEGRKEGRKEEGWVDKKEGRQGGKE